MQIINYFKINLEHINIYMYICFILKRKEIMNTYKTNDKNQNLNAFNTFRNEHGNGETGFSTLELAQKFISLKRDWWGSNLVILDTLEKDGRFYPQFNVFD